MENDPAAQVFVQRISKLVCLITLMLFGSALFVIPGHAQQKHDGVAKSAAPLLTRSATRQLRRRLSYGGTVTIVGAPEGSIKIEGWPRSEVEIIADIELHAATEEDLNLLATVNAFVLDEDPNHLRVLTTGTHDKVFMRRVAKKFPKNLLGLPWKIDYRIFVPVSTDLEINAGRGQLKLSGVEGAINISGTESDATVTSSGGTVIANIGSGKVLLTIPVRSWRGGGADVRIGAGELKVDLATGFNGDIDADILRTGKIEDSFGELESREKPGLTERTIRARAGAGGAFFKFTVGVGTITFRKSLGGER